MYLSSAGFLLIDMYLSQKFYLKRRMHLTLVYDN